MLVVIDAPLDDVVVEVAEAAAVVDVDVDAGALIVKVTPCKEG